ncbi:MAG: hypothetical protein QM451_03355 [Bacillota bacterium]|nr:hypothetical protein [Bacillota bacterium]HHT89585.1 hypothetical protein [Bacillota bacterium]
MRKLNFLFAIALLVVFSGTVLAQGIPVDIPGTGVNFFLYRYEGEVPYKEIDAIWDNISQVFQAWVDSGQDPGALSGQDVQVRGADIFVKNQFIVTADQYHANANKATPSQLAEKWAANLRKGVDAFVAINVLKD